MTTTTVTEQSSSKSKQRKIENKFIKAAKELGAKKQMVWQCPHGVRHFYPYSDNYCSKCLRKAMSAQ